MLKWMLTFMSGAQGKQYILKQVMSTSAVTHDLSLPNSLSMTALRGIKKK